ncbi:MAG TPA: OmpA family protein [Clostridiaceae bacterium]|nr:OmpA family protein [Clostridiaceae bacterium]
MKVRTRRFRNLSGTENFWPSFTDVISTIVLILFFIMLLTYIQNLLTGKNLETAKLNLEQAQLTLDAKNLEIEEAEKQLRLLEVDIEETKAQLEESKLQLILLSDEIEKQNQIILTKETELANKETLIAITLEQLENQKKIIAASNAELEKLRLKLQDIALLRISVLEKVKKSIEEKIGNSNDKGEPLVSIGDNANIIINESLFFDFAKAEIKPVGFPLLLQLSLAFEELLDDNEVKNYIDAIVIEGHTDSIGDPESNRKLSAERAYNVVNKLMEFNPSLENKYGEYFAASGYSEFRPIASNDTESGRQQNRRIEISVVIKDSNIQSIINDYLDETEIAN